jgi:hypothetical protein
VPHSLPGQSELTHFRPVSEWVTYKARWRRDPVEDHTKQCRQRVDSSVTIAVCRVHVSLDCVIDFVPVNWHLTRSGNTKPDFVASDLNDHHADVVTDTNFLIGFATKD